jgi:SAM-dependent methyltransferase
LRLVDPTGRRPTIRLSPAEWCGSLRLGDEALLDRCHGPTLDVGCGPGRLTAALGQRSIPALGIDISLEAVRQTQRRGAVARLACVLTTELESRWQHVLLADGNIGIGGDPGALLARCGGLLRPGGDVIVELDPPTTSSWSGTVSLGYRGALSTPFAWAVVAASDIHALAWDAAMSVLETWTEADRWFARIAPC